MFHLLRVSTICPIEWNVLSSGVLQLRSGSGDWINCRQSFLDSAAVEDMAELRPVALRLNEIDPNYLCTDIPLCTVVRDREHRVA